MDMITLNNTVQMPMLGFGTFLMNGKECEESVLTALHSGYRLIDTAEAYGNEEAVGNAIIKSGCSRKDLFLVTKVNFRSYENTRATVATSLKKLQTDYLDLVLLHWPFGNYYAAWRELERLYREGKIRAIGVSNFDPDRFIDLIEFNEVTPAVNQIETHLLCQRRAEHEGSRNTIFNTWLTLHWDRDEKMKCLRYRIWLKLPQLMARQPPKLRYAFLCRAAWLLSQNLSMRSA